MKTCKVEECSQIKVNKITGLCHKHHLRFTRYGTTELSRNKVDKTKKCIVKGCDRYQQTNAELCLMHYKRLKRTGTTDLRLREKKKCRYCDKYAVAKELCDTHYYSYKTHGDAEYVSKKISKITNSYGYKKSLGKHNVEHRAVYEQHHKDELSKKDVIHHVDLDKQNNCISNLYKCNKSEHAKMHHQLNAIAGELIRMGIISFDKNGKYYIKKEYLELLKCYKMTGNGWTNDMIVHGLQPLVKEFGGNSES